MWTDDMFRPIKSKQRSLVFSQFLHPKTINRGPHNPLRGRKSRTTSKIKLVNQTQEFSTNKQEIKEAPDIRRSKWRFKNKLLRPLNLQASQDQVHQIIFKIKISSSWIKSNLKFKINLRSPWVKSNKKFKIKLSSPWIKSEERNQRRPSLYLRYYRDCNPYSWLKSNIHLLHIFLSRFISWHEFIVLKIFGMPSGTNFALHLFLL